jgi:prepilin-type processing-associated H-X9-DG protein
VAVAALCAGMAGGEQARRIRCFNNLRQLGIGMQSFSTEHGGKFPERLFATNAWLERLRPYLAEPHIFRCPSDARYTVDRSYIYNGWQDYLGGLGFTTNAVAESDIAEPAQTALIGEKESASAHLYLDIAMGDDFIELNQARHLSGGRSSGASNYLFVDGSVRLLKFGGSLVPVNLWAITPEYRNNPMILP